MGRQDFKLHLGEDRIRSTPLPTSNRSGSGFFGLSTLAHLALFFWVATLSLPAVEKPEQDLVQFEIEGESSSPTGAAAAAPSAPAPSVPAPPVVSTPAEIPATTAPVPATQPLPPKETAKAVVQKAAPIKAAPTKAMPAPSAQKTLLAEESPVEVPAHLDDIETPDLNESFKQAEEKLAPSLNEDELQDELAQSKVAAVAPVEDLQKELLEEAERVEKVQEQELAALAEQNEQEQRRMEAKAEELRRRQAEALAQAQAAAAAQAQKSAGQAQSGQGPGQSLAVTSASTDQGAGQSQGKGGGVRSLDQLRQMPGNPRPAYSESERLQQQQGQVVFLAYISKDGQPIRFQQLQSTGHANLDTKTLEALKKWRFYPGQEGWVEIPFQWNLRGGPQETPALGRRRASR